MALNKDRWLQYGQEGLDIKGLIIHNTGSDLSASELFNWLNSEDKSSEGCHYLIDHEKTIEVMPLSWKTWSTGKGNDWAFEHCIVVQICSNNNDSAYKIGQDRACLLIRDLMDRYSLPVERVYFHNDFNPLAYCPADILRIYKTKENFIKEELCPE